MIILGIDPGTARCGYGVISDEKGGLSLIECGLIETAPADDAGIRLKHIFERACELIQRFSPEVVSIEQLFYGSNVSTALAVGQARGVVLLAAASHGVKVAEYTPLQVKQIVVGYGKAEKHQVQYMVQTLLKMSKPPTPDDTSDALAVAICYAHSRRMMDKVEAQ